MMIAANDDVELIISEQDRMESESFSFLFYNNTFSFQDSKGLHNCEMILKNKVQLLEIKRNIYYYPAGYCTYSSFKMFVFLFFILLLLCIFFLFRICLFCVRRNKLLPVKSPFAIMTPRTIDPPALQRRALLLTT